MPYGSYLVAELQPPSGYYLNQEDRLSVEVRQNVSPVTSDAVGAPLKLENARIPYAPSVGTLAVEKTSEDGRREGFSFRITDGRSYSRTFRTDGDGCILVQNLPVGTYTVTEVEDEAVRGVYVLPEPQSAVVTLQGAKLSFYNRLAPTESPSPSVSVRPTESPTASPELFPSAAPTPTPAPAPGEGGINGPHTGYDGHNTDRLALFGPLTQYISEEFWREHPEIHFDTPVSFGVYSVFSVFLTTADAGDPNAFDFTRCTEAVKPEAYARFVDGFTSRALYDTGVAPAYGKGLLLLVTCQYSAPQGRIVVAAVESRGPAV